MVASDLDGTVVRSDGTFSDRTRTAIAAVEAAGASFVMSVLVLVLGHLVFKRFEGTVLKEI